MLKTKDYFLTKAKAFWMIGFAMLLSLLLHLPHMGKDLMGIHVWRQSQTQNTINSFYEEDMNILNPRQNVRGGTDGIYRMEFPLMQWGIAAIYHITGEQVWVTRWIMFLIYLFTTAGFAYACYHAFQNWMSAVLASWAFCFSPEIFYYGINPLPDVLALCFCAWGLGWFLKYHRFQQQQQLLVAGVFLGLSALVKLPFILFYAIPYAYFLFVKKELFKKEVFIKNVLPFSVSLLPVVAWYGMVIGSWQGNGIVGGVLESNASISTLAEYVIHHVLSTLPEMFINYAALPVFLFGCYLLFKQKHKSPVLFPFVCGFLLVLLYFLFEINMIEKVHDYYLFPFYPFVVLMIGYGATRIMNWHKVGVVFVVLLLLLTPVTAYLRRANSWNPQNPGFNRDLLIYKGQLRAAVPDNALCIVGNDPAQHAFLYYVHKKGWVFSGDNYDAGKLQKAINEVAQYLYSDSRLIDEESSAQTLLEEKVAEFGSIRIYRLKQKGVANPQ